MVIETLQFTVIVFLLVTASILDLRYREIPNWISVTIVLTALLNFDVRNLWGLIAAALIFIIALVTGKIGGGDVKLIMVNGEPSKTERCRRSTVTLSAVTIISKSRCRQ